MARGNMGGGPFVQLSPKSPSGDNVIQGAEVHVEVPTTLILSAVKIIVSTAVLRLYVL